MPKKREGKEKVMYKEMIISIILAIVIFLGDFITQNYTDSSINSFKEEILNLKNALMENNQESAEEKIENVETKWENIQNKMAYYIEHNELEKVETNLAEAKSFTNSGNFEFAISALDKTDSILEHINDKYTFSLENIF